jgi:hypothetical protein
VATPGRSSSFPDRHPAQLLIRIGVGVALVLFAQVCAAGQSSVLVVGGAWIAIPAPAGFKDVMSNPAARWLAQPYRSAVHDVAALYVPEGIQVEKVEAGGDIGRHMVLLQPRSPELQRPKSYREFRDDEELRQRIAKENDLRVIRDSGTSAVTLAVRSGPPVAVVVATSSMLVRERLVTFHVVSVLQSAEDSQWVIDTTLRWIEAIDAANP